jgi:hypothetical protein
LRRSALVLLPTDVAVIVVVVVAVPLRLHVWLLLSVWCPSYRL